MRSRPAGVIGRWAGGRQPAALGALALVALAAFAALAEPASGQGYGGGQPPIERGRPRRALFEPEAGERPFQPSGGDPAVAEALLAEAIRLEEEGERLSAHDLYREILDEHPDFARLGEVIRRDFQTGLDFLAGKATRQVLFFDVTAREKGVDILVHLIERYEQKGFDEARFLIAEYYFEDEEEAQAAEHYLRVEEDYPESLFVGQSRYKRALCYLRLHRGYAYDDRDVRQGEALLIDYLRRYPEGDRAEDARARLKDIRGLRAELWIDNARYYLRREKSPRASLVYLESILREAPDAEAAEEVRPLLETIAALGQEDPESADRATALLARAARLREERQRAAAATTGAPALPAERRLQPGEIEPADMPTGSPGR